MRACGSCLAAPHIDSNSAWACKSCVDLDGGDGEALTDPSARLACLECVGAGAGPWGCKKCGGLGDAGKRAACFACLREAGSGGGAGCVQQYE